MPPDWPKGVPPSRTVALTLVSILVLAAGCVGAPMSDPGNIDPSEDPDGVLDALDERHAQIDDVYGIATIEIEVDGEVDETTVAVWERPGEATRLSVIESTRDDLEGTETVFDGETVWYVDENAESIAEFEAAFDDVAFPYSTADSFEPLLDRYGVQLDGTETIAGHETHHLVLTPNDEAASSETGINRLEVWIDDEHWYPVKRSVEASVGDRSVSLTITFEALSFDEVLEDERVTFASSTSGEGDEEGDDGNKILVTEPGTDSNTDEDETRSGSGSGSETESGSGTTPGSEAGSGPGSGSGADTGTGTDGDAESDADFPSVTTYESIDEAASAVDGSIPVPDFHDDYGFGDVTVTEYGGETTVSLLYHDGDGNEDIVVTISTDGPVQNEAWFDERETIEQGGIEHTVLESGDITVVHWTCGDRDYEVGGELDRDELLTLSAGVPCE